jgi:recombination protein RecA
MAVNNGLIEKSGSWYAYQGERIGQGKDNARTYLQSHPEIAKSLDEALRQKLLVARRGQTGVDPRSAPPEAAEG